MDSNPPSRKSDSCRRADWFALCEFHQFWGWLIIAAIAIVAGLSLPILARFKNAAAKDVIVYTSQDQVYAEPILKEFSRQTGIRVRAVYDSESVKTVGLVNRLIAEQDNPRCDIFWNNEELRTRQLLARGVIEKWAAIGYRSRRMAVNTQNLPLASAPHSLVELTNEIWRGKVALAYPLFGTTATHFLALRQAWGDRRWHDWCRALAANKPFLVDGNSPAAQLVAKGEAWVALTDSDDIAAEQREGAPVVALPPGADSLAIPNTIAVVRGSPHPQAAAKLFEYLQRSDVVERLVATHALEGVSCPYGTERTLVPDWNKLLAELDTDTESLKQIFLR